MSEPTLRHRAEYLGFRAARGLIGLLPLSAVRRLGRATGRLYFLVGREHRRRALFNLARTLPGDPAQHEAVARRCFESYGGIFLESLHAYGRDPERLMEHIDIDGLEHLDAARALGRGCIVVTGHYGSWELALWPLGRHLGKIHAIARPMTNPAVNREVEQLRLRVGYELLPVKSVGIRMYKTLRRGGNVALVFDQRVKPRNGVLVPFLDRPAWLTPLVASLSIRTGAPVVPVFCVPQGKDRYRFNLLPPIVPEGQGPQAELAMMRRCLEPLEQRIRQKPELWLWMHRLWRLTQRESRADLLAFNRKVSGLEPEAAAIELDEALVALTGSEFLERADNAVVVAEWDVGRRAGRAVAERVLQSGHRVRFVGAAEFADELSAARSGSALARAYRDLDVCDLLVVDGLGRESLAEDRARELAELFAQRHGRRSTVVTTRVAPDDWEQIFGSVAATESARQSVGERSIQLAGARG